MIELIGISESDVRGLRNIMAEAGIQGVTLHSFRRTVATLLNP
jgi:integrase